ncbi:MAG: LamG domain-containing protein [Fibrobacter sp.]|nr:LamG domain-containing protein [Fibrobacter sp.]
MAFYPFSESFENTASTEIDSSENHGATFAKDRFGNENSSAYFDGNETFLEIPDNDAFSISTTGALTISVWVSPEVLNFQKAEAGGYVHWMGKGVPHQHEWVFRMYNKDLSQGQENRPNRMSAYAFNLEGGLGAGSYVQEQVQENEWIHFVARYDVQANKITLFKNGVQKDQDDLYDATYGVQVQNGTAPLRLGTRSQWSYFQGRIDDLRIYNRALSDSEIVELYNEPNAKASNTETEETEELNNPDSSKTQTEEKQEADSTQTTEKEQTEELNKPDSSKTQIEEKQVPDSTNTATKEQTEEAVNPSTSEKPPQNKQEPQALRKGSKVLEKPKVNFRRQKFYDLKGRRVRYFSW